MLYLNICWGNVHYLSVLQDKRFRESDGIVVITIFFMDERFCAFVLLLSICCVNNAFFSMLQYIWDILYRDGHVCAGTGASYVLSAGQHGAGLPSQDP